MELSVFLRFCEVGLFVFMPICGFMLMPAVYKSYVKWQTTHKSAEFAAFVIQSALSLCFLISIFPLFATRVLDLYFFSKDSIYALLICLILSCMLGYWTLPQMLSYYQKLKLEKKSIHFALMGVFGVLSFYGMSPLFIIVIYSVLPK